MYLIFFSTDAVCPSPLNGNGNGNGGRGGQKSYNVIEPYYYATIKCLFYTHFTNLAPCFYSNFESISMFIEDVEFYNPLRNIIKSQNSQAYVCINKEVSWFMMIPGNMNF